MLQVLDTTNKSIVVSPSSDIQWTIAWSDVNATSSIESSSSGNSNPTIDVVLASGQSGVRRIVRSITIHNSNPSLQRSFTLLLRNVSSDSIIAKGVLNPGSTWYSTDPMTLFDNVSYPIVPGDKGDIIVNENGTWTIDNTAVTLAKIQNITDQRLLGRAAGTSGTTQELTVSSILSLSGGALDFASQNAGLVLASPATTSGTPTFRSLVASDIPSLASIYQPLDSDLTAIAALSGDGLLRKSSGTWAMDSASYLTGNQTITLSGDVTGSGTTAITTTIANNAVTTAKILNDNVTFAKIANITSGNLLGRKDSGAGDIQEITPSSGVLAWLQDATSAKLATAITDETGSGSLVFGTAPTITSPTVSSGNLNFSGVSQRILGNFSDADTSKRLTITSNISGGNAIVQVVPESTGAVGFRFHSSGTNFTDYSIFQMFMFPGGTATFNSGKVGLGTALPLQFLTDSILRIFVDINGNIGFNGSSFGTGVKVLHLANASTVPNPANPPSDGGILYATSGQLWWLGSSGTATKLANA